MRSETIVSSLIIITMVIGIVIAALGASTHGTVSIAYTNLLVVFGVLIVAGFALTAVIVRRTGSKRVSTPDVDV